MRAEVNVTPGSGPNATVTVLLGICIVPAVFAAASEAALAQAAPCGEDVGTVEANGTTLHYFECGEGEPVVFVHGSTGDFGWAIPSAREFASDYRAIAYSRRYHAPNAPPGPGDEYALALHVADLAALIRELGLGPAHLVGHSYGGYVALGLALEHPDLVRSLVLGEPPVLPLLPRTDVGAALLESFYANTRDPARDTLAAGHFEEGLRIFTDAVVFPGWFDGLDPAARQGMVESAGPEFRLEFLTDPGRYMPPLACARLSELEKPVLLLTGEESIASLYLVTAELEGCLEGEEHVMVPEAGHVMFMNREFFDDAVLGFLRDN